MGARTLTDAKRPTGESDQETAEVGSSVTGSASHRSVADSAAAIVITPPGRTSAANCSMVSAGSPRSRATATSCVPRQAASCANSSPRPCAISTRSPTPSARDARRAWSRRRSEASTRRSSAWGRSAARITPGSPAPVPTSTMRPWNSSNDAENDEHTARANQTVCSTSASTGAVPMTPAARAGVQASSSEAS